MQIKNAIYQGTISGKQVVVDHERLKYNKFLILPVIVGIIFYLPSNGSDGDNY
ncbi:hypothetical protein ACO2FJ_03845 [Staphylococcus warneri]